MENAEHTTPPPVEPTSEAPVKQKPLPPKRGEEKEKGASSFKRMIVLFKKTWSDIFTVKKFVISLIFMSLIPLLTTALMPAPASYSAMSEYSVGMAIAFQLQFFMYTFTVGLIFILIISAQAAGLIADEVDRGTMLILVSKPIGRVQIFLGKFLAIFLYGVLLSFSGIFAVSWITVLVKTGNLDHWLQIAPIMGFFFLYSVFVELIFLTITMALSSIMKKGRSVGMILILIIIMTYFGFFLIRMIASSAYEKYYLYYPDIGYHLANVFVLFNDWFNALPPSSSWQSMFTMFTGAYDTGTADTAQNIDLGNLELAGYTTPLFSLLFWVGLAVVLLFVGLWKLKTKEISN